jgi:hypothetical protein
MSVIGSYGVGSNVVLSAEPVFHKCVSLNKLHNLHASDHSLVKQKQYELQCGLIEVIGMSAAVGIV